MNEPVVAVRDLTKIHAPGTPREVRALDGITFAIPRGGYAAIVGESGSGKTTLMHVLGALDRPSSGSLVVDGLALERASRTELTRFRAARVGFVFQGFNLLPNLTALDNVRLARRYAHRDGSASDAQRLLEAVGLGDRLDHRPAELSGGQQQRVAIARALVNEPAIVLADEPTGELDTRTATAILDLFDTLHRERGQTIIVVTHSQAVWERAQQVIRLRDGRIEAIEGA